MTTREQLQEIAVEAAKEMGQLGEAVVFAKSFRMNERLLDAIEEAREELGRIPKMSAFSHHAVIKQRDEKIARVDRVLKRALENDD